MENLTDKDLIYLAICDNKAIFISCIAFILLLWTIYLAISNFKQIARMKVDCEEAIKQNQKDNEHKTFK
jgi:hypothetical protein